MIFALCAVASATASAAWMPQIVNAKGELPGKTGFTGTGAASTFETKSGEAVRCKESKTRGKITGASSDEAETKFTGCSAVAGLLKCKSKGSASGEIVFKVDSELVWLNEAEESEPGEDLSLPEAVTIECTGLASETLKVKGSSLCQVTPFQTLGTTATLACKQTKGVQTFTKYFLEGNDFTDVTETEGTGVKRFAFEQSGLESTNTLTFEEGVAIAGPPVVSVEPTEYTFRAFGGVKKFKYTNRGPGTWTPGTPLIFPVEESFNVKGNTCAGNIPLGGECEITVEFTGPEGEALIHFPPARSAILK
ncbi:MAG: hypothetical protein ACLQBY_02145 [Solirubrobacteraceae bacterium]